MDAVLQPDGYEYFDSHCHIHDKEFFDEAASNSAYLRSVGAGVAEMLCIGTEVESSKDAVSFAERHDGAYATVGVHPHETKDGVDGLRPLLEQGSKKLVGIGEIGLDYFYGHSPREAQIDALNQQLQWARDYNLPVSFHVREAFDDFWPIFDNFTYRNGSKIRGVLHSFTDNHENLTKGLARGLYVAVNGISTFTKDSTQKQLFSQIPLDRLLLETDAPFLTPTPFRGKVNEPAYVKRVASDQASQRNVDLGTLVNATTSNARALFLDKK